MSKEENNAEASTQASRRKNKKALPSTTVRTLYYFLTATKKYRWYALGSLLVTPAVIILRTTLPPLLLSKMIEIASAETLPDNLISLLLPYALAYLGVQILRNFVLDPLRLWFVWRMEIKAMFDLGNKVFETISAQSMQFHSDHFSGSLVSQSNKFIGAYESFMDEFFWNVYPVAINFISIAAVMTPRVPLFTLVMFVLIVVFLLVAKLWFKKLGPIHEREASVSAKVTGQLSDSISNIFAVKSYAREDFEKKRYSDFNSDWLRTSNDALVANTKRNFCFDGVQLFLTAAILSLLIFGRTKFGLSVATLILITNYASSILSDLWSIHSIFKSFNRIFGNAKEMTEILDMEDDVVDAENAVPLKISKGKVEFKNISFRHADAKTPIFTDLSLTINPGERVGLVGVSGSGKTTITKLLLRFADVSAGTIEIDGQDIKLVTQKSLREAVAYVPQESALFHRTISENIAYAKPRSLKKDIIHAACLANADAFIKELPDGYKTMVGERGIKLSGGQRQRIAIARAILKDAPILVLDEATSALDSESESLIQEALLELMKGRTSLVIAHRLSTVASLDRIVVLKNGQIIEQGSHSDLLAQGGAYAHLWSRQSGAFLD